MGVPIGIEVGVNGVKTHAVSRIAISRFQAKSRYASARCQKVRTVSAPELKEPRMAEMTEMGPEMLSKG